MLFSVIIPTFNRLPLLKESLESVWSQTFTDYEVIVVDDGSTDGTADFARAFGGGIRFFEQANRGPGAARNLAVKHASGDYIAFLDSDDLWFPWTLATYARCVAAHPRPSLVGGCAVHFDVSATLPQTEAPLQQQCHECLFAAMLARNLSLPTPAVAFRRESFLDVGGFRELYIAEDLDLWLRAGCLAGFVHIENPPICAERRHNARITRELRPTLTGIKFALAEELRGRYPGAEQYAPLRRARLARAARSISIACLDQGLMREACRLYWNTLGINFRLGRWRYIVGFPLRAATSATGRQFTKLNPV